MNILYIDHYAGSLSLGMEFRPFYLAREWQRQGHRVLVVAGAYSHLRLKQPDKIGMQNIDGVEYLTLKTLKYKGSGLIRALSMFQFTLLVWLKSRYFAKRFCPDVVIASSTYPLDNYPAKRIARLASCRYVYEVHDLWPLSPMLIGGYSSRHPFIHVMQWAENYAYKHVDKVVSLLWNAESHMCEHGLGSGKFVCIPNGYSPEEWIESKTGDIPREHQKVFDVYKDRLIVGFAGGFVPSGALHVLIEAASLLSERTDIHFVLVGRGVEESKLKLLVEQRGLSNVSFMSSVPKSILPAVVARFDVAYMGGTHSVLHQFGTSYNKQIDYMLAGKPILQSIDEPNSLIERLQCGIRVDAENHRAIADAVLKILAMPVAEREMMGLQGKQHAEQFLQWNALAQRFLDAVFDS